MEVSQLDILFLFWYSFFGGALLGIFNDVVRAVGTLFFRNGGNDHKNRMLFHLTYNVYNAVFDICVPVLGAVMTIIIAYAKNSGVIRWLIPVGVCAGFGVYRATVGKVVKRLLSLMARIIKRIAKIVFFIIKYPFSAVKGMLKKKKREMSRKGGENGKRHKKRNNKKNKEYNNNSSCLSAVGILNNNFCFKVGQI